MSRGSKEDGRQSAGEKLIALSGSKVLQRKDFRREKFTIFQSEGGK